MEAMLGVSVVGSWYRCWSWLGLGLGEGRAHLLLKPLAPCRCTRGPDKTREAGGDPLLNRLDRHTLSMCMIHVHMHMVPMHVHVHGEPASRPSRRRSLSRALRGDGVRAATAPTASVGRTCSRHVRWWDHDAC